MVTLDLMVTPNLIVTLVTLSHACHIWSIFSHVVTLVTGGHASHI